MQHQPTEMPRHASAERRAFRQFADGVLAFADDPGPANLERYLAASRALEESRRSGHQHRLALEANAR